MNPWIAVVINLALLGLNLWLSWRSGCEARVGGNLARDGRDAYTRANAALDQAKALNRATFRMQRGIRPRSWN